MASPLRGPKSSEGGGFAAAHLLARRACYGAAPPASRVLRIALRATAPAGLPLTPETTAAPGSRKSGQARPAPALRAARKPGLWRGHRTKPNVRTQVNWRSIVARKRKITNLGWVSRIK
jgi:hypothetical protein